MKNQKLTIAAIAAVLITGILAGGITYGVLSARFSRETNALNKRLAALEKAQNKKAAVTKATPDIYPSAAQAEEAKYGDWLTYTNTEIGYTVRYPTDWEFKVSAEEVDGKAVKNVTFSTSGTEYYVTVGLRVKGSDTLLTSRTGTGLGDIKDAGTLDVLGVKAKKTNLVYKNKIKTVFYGGSGGVFEAQGFQGSAEFSKIDTGDYAAIDLTGVPEGIIADKIVSSLNITK